MNILGRFHEQRGGVLILADQLAMIRLLMESDMDELDADALSAPGLPAPLAWSARPVPAVILRTRSQCEVDQVPSLSWYDGPRFCEIRFDGARIDLQVATWDNVPVREVGEAYGIEERWGVRLNGSDVALEAFARYGPAVLTCAEMAASTLLQPAADEARPVA